MNKEEKEAIEEIKNDIAGVKVEKLLYGRQYTACYIDTLETVLNLIFKQQKEIEELKKYYEQKLEDYYNEV